MRKTRVGTVVSNKMDKSAIVRVDRMVPHPKYGKRFRLSTRLVAHDPENQAQVGDTAVIREVRPMSKTKQWEITSIHKNTQPDDVALLDAEEK